jgi:hypothetical protein
VKVNIELIVCFANKTWDTTIIPLEVQADELSDEGLWLLDGAALVEDEFVDILQGLAEAKLEVTGEAEVVHIGVNFYQFVDEAEDEIDKVLDLANWTLVSEGEHPLPKVVTDAIQKASEPTNLREAFMKAVMVDSAYPIDEPNIPDDIDDGFDDPYLTEDSSLRLI